MADNYVQSSFMIVCASKDEADLFMKIIGLFEALAEKKNCGDELCIDESWPLSPEDMPLAEKVKDLVESYEANTLGFQLRFEGKDNIWIHDNGESIDIDQCVDIIQLWLSQKEVKTKPVRLTWACTCSKPHIDEFDGGGCVVTSEGSFFMNSPSFNEYTVRGLSLPSLQEQFNSTEWNPDSQLAVLDALFEENPHMKALLQDKIAAQHKFEESLTQ